MSSFEQAATCSGAGSLHFVVCKGCCLRPKAIRACHPSQYVHNHSAKLARHNPCLAISNHHLEYGFPSTHSTNSISIALFIYTHVHRLATLPVPSTNLITTLAPPTDWSISLTTYWISTLLLAWYTFSIVYGRLYCAMHSFVDCAMGVAMGAVIWAVYWVTEDAVENWLIHAGWSG